MKNRSWSGAVLCLLLCMLLMGVITEGSAKETQAATTYRNRYVLKGGKWYFYNARGQITKGWVTTRYGTFYFDSKTGAATPGIVEISGKKYCFNEKGQMLRNWQIINGKRYFFDGRSGQMYTGWKNVSGRLFCFFADGAVRPGWQKIGNTTYYFSPYGLMMRNCVIKDNGKRYLIDSKGQKKTGRYKIGGKWYAFDTETGALVENGWYKENNASYYANKAGQLVTGFYKPDSKYRYFQPSDGKMLVGWQTIAGSRYLFNIHTGMRYDNQKVTIGKNMFYFNASGKLYRGRWFTASGKKYFANSSGILLTGWQTAAGNKYYFNSEGILQTGWVQIDSKRYYFNPTTGIMAKSTWIGNYYVGSDGAYIPGYKDYGFRWPLDSQYNWVCSYFGPRTAPGPNASTYHQGIDIASKTESVNGKPIYAVGDGTVIVIQTTDESGGAGNYTQINHGDGIISEYMHQSNFATGLKVGMKVKKGQLIGYVGNTGTSYGAHLHLGFIVNGVRKDPLLYVQVPTE